MRRRFRGSKLGPADWPFVFAQQIKDAATRWLQPGGSAGEGRMLEKIVLEQFVEGLPAATSDWVICHRPADLAGAITLAEDHLAVLSRGRAQEGRPASPGGPTPAPRRGPASGPPQNAPARPFPRPRTTFRAPQAAGQECWRCGQLGHFRGECPLMEVGQVIQVPDRLGYQIGSGSVVY
ncbi:Neurotrophin receptor-interacting factor [Merluccius polli]|uniref:Neurotrophin receptor-interacting factor n=1 Tax=Merluccius polli TaxID=89951 RepID=A0AA47MMB3_MERPO|nr:Neurotrophin receptor-interacting factor [Merluccius polli]